MPTSYMLAALTLSIGLAIGFPLGHLWQKHRYRVRADARERRRSEIIEETSAAYRQARDAFASLERTGQASMGPEKRA